MQAVKRKARVVNGEVYPPILLPGEYYRDGDLGLFHLRTPDGTHMAVTPAKRKCKCCHASQATASEKDGKLCITGAIEWAGAGRRGDKIHTVPNLWTVRDGEWIRTGAEVTEEEVFA